MAESCCVSAERCALERKHSQRFLGFLDCNQLKRNGKSKAHILFRGELLCQCGRDSKGNEAKRAFHFSFRGRSLSLRNSAEVECLNTQRYSASARMLFF